MTGSSTLEQRIARAAQRLDDRHQDLLLHRQQWQSRVLGQVRKSPVIAVAGVALLLLTWHNMRYRRRH